MKPSLILASLAILTALATGCNPLQSAPQPTPTPLLPLTPVVLEPDEGLLWIREFGTDWGDKANALAVDDEGNIYLVGTMGGSLPEFQTLFIGPFIRKYDPAGNVLWTKRLREDGFGRASDVTVDAQGNVYVSGSIEFARSDKPQGKRCFPKQVRRQWQ